MNTLRLKIFEFFKDFWKSFIVIDSSINIFQFITIFFARIISFFLYTLFNILKSIWTFHVDKKNTIYDKIFIYLEEILIFYLVPYYLIFYYLFRFFFFLFVFFLRLILIIVFTVLEYLEILFPAHNSEWRDIFRILKKMASRLDLWHYTKAAAFCRNSFQFLFIWLFYFFVIILYDSFIYPYIARVFMLFIKAFAGMLLTIIEFFIRWYDIAFLFLTNDLYDFFFTYSKKRKKFYVLLILKRIISYVLILFDFIFLAYLLIISYMREFLSKSYSFWVAIIKFVRRYIYLCLAIIFDIFSTPALISLISSTILAAFLFMVNWIYYLVYVILKPFYLIFVFFFRVASKFTLFNEIVDILFYLGLSIIYKLPKPVVNTILFICLYIYLLIIVACVIVLKFLANYPLFIYKLKYNVNRFSHFIKLVFFKFINFFTYIAFFIYVTYSCFYNLKKIIFFECVAFVYVCKFFFVVKYLRSVYFIKKVLYYITSSIKSLF